MFIPRYRIIFCQRIITSLFYIIHVIEFHSTSSDPAFQPLIILFFLHKIIILRSIKQMSQIKYLLNFTFHRMFIPVGLFLISVSQVLILSPVKVLADWSYILHRAV